MSRFQIEPYSYTSTSGGRPWLGLNDGTGPQRSTSLNEIQSLIKEHVDLDVGHSFQGARRSDDELKRIKNKQVRQYYKNLNKQLDYFQEVDDLLRETTHAVAHVLASEGSPLLPITREGVAERAEVQETKNRVAINVNFIINVILLAAKVLVVVLASSLSLLASAVDSGMDFLSTLIIFFTARAAGESDSYKYPIGKSRLEPLGVVVFSVCMITSFAQVLVESVQRLFDKNLVVAELPIAAIVAMVATVVVKMLVWLAYRSFKSQSIRALSQDAMNDVVFNTVSLIFPYVGKALHWKYLDPLGAMLLSIYIMVEWIETLWECVSDLIGQRADPIQHQRIIYLVTRFSPLVKAVQHVNVYTGGGGMIVEIDVLLPKTISLPKAHDVCECLQYSIENLEGIQRAYVHADYHAQNPSGHQVR